MSKAQPGAGYGFTSSGYGFSLNTLPPFPEQEASAPDHPFKVSIYWSEESAMFFATVTAGTINNIVPVIWGGGPADDLLTAIPKPEMGLATVQVPPGEFYVYVRSGKSPTAFDEFPDSDRNNPGYPQVYFSASTLIDSDEFGYIMLAQAQVTVATKTVNYIAQFVTGSLWASRIKVGNLTAKYFYARV